MKRLEELPEHATPSRDCPKCSGKGLIPVAEEFYATIGLCDCIHPAPCPRCGGSGHILAIMDGVERVGRCKCQIIPDRVRVFNFAKLPARYAGASFETFQASDPTQRTAKDAAEQWTKDFANNKTRRGLLLYGEVGRGKTHLLASIVRRLTIEHRIQVRFVEFSLLLWELMEGFERGGGRSKVLSPLRHVDVLAIDEIGKGRCTEFELSVLDELITARYNDNKVVLGTTNYPPGEGTGEKTPNLALHGSTYASKTGDDERPVSSFSTTYRVPTLVDRVGDRVYSRLLEMVMVIGVQGKDMRGTLSQPYLKPAEPKAPNTQPTSPGRQTPNVGVMASNRRAPRGVSHLSARETELQKGPVLRQKLLIELQNVPVVATNQQAAHRMKALLEKYDQLEQGYVLDEKIEDVLSRLRNLAGELDLPLSRDRSAWPKL